MKEFPLRCYFFPFDRLESSKNEISKLQAELSRKVSAKLTDAAVS